jgi:hypothetical protein
MNSFEKNYRAKKNLIALSKSAVGGREKEEYETMKD